ncbi:MAG: hypothetical protein J7L77_08090, partial [Clostridiales bacterium]|nr:hypothetical protein [Clostridiales bacterium]
KLDGRTYETINTPVGSLVTVYEFKNIFEKFPTVSDFQIVQIDSDLMEVRLKYKVEKLTANETSDLTGNILECNLNIDIVYVDEVTKLPSGKILRVIPAHFDTDIENKLIYY